MYVIIAGGRYFRTGGLAPNYGHFERHLQDGTIFDSLARALEVKNTSKCMEHFEQNELRFAQIYEIKLEGPE